MQAKVTWTEEQIEGSLPVPHSFLNTARDSTGDALVLPTGHVINKARRMNASDIATFKPFVFTTECVNADLAYMINLYGYQESEQGLKAANDRKTELYLCPCKHHRDTSRTYRYTRHQKFRLPLEKPLYFQDRAQTTYGIK